MARLALGVTEMDLMDKRRQNTKKSITSLADGGLPGGVYWIWWHSMYGTLGQAKKRGTCAPYFSGSLSLPPTVGRGYWARDCRRGVPNSETVSGSPPPRGVWLY